MVSLVKIRIDGGLNDGFLSLIRNPAAKPSRMGKQLYRLPAICHSNEWQFSLTLPWLPGLEKPYPNAREILFEMIEAAHPPNRG